MQLGMEQGPPCEETLSAWDGTRFTMWGDSECLWENSKRTTTTKKGLWSQFFKKQTNKQKPHNFGMHFNAPPWCVGKEDRGLVQISWHNWLLFFVYMHSGKTWFCPVWLVLVIVHFTHVVLLTLRVQWLMFWIKLANAAPFSQAPSPLNKLAIFFIKITFIWQYWL